ncbi:MAG: NADH:flavin oxidoreductase [Deltaproteobacteria bacterium]|nr:NADH:flavin oxidoreductase [Deltaproteobacteria bacterium]
MPTLHDAVMINGIELRNRVVLPPLTTNNGSPDGQVTDGVIQFYKERAKDVGLVIVEAASVRSDGRIVPGSLGLWEEGQVAGLACIAEVIQKSGSAAVLQINHAGARGFPSGGEMQGASPSGYSFRPDVTPFSMTLEQIDTLTSDFVAAAGRAKNAGFDGVEIHGAHLYLISQFLSPLSNQRDDRYGGDALGRATLALEVVKAVRERLGDNYPLIFRFNVVEHVEEGQKLTDGLEVARALTEAGVDALDVSLVTQGSWQEQDGKKILLPASAFSKEQPPGANIPFVAAVKEATGLPVIGVGKLGNAMAAKSVEGSFMDLVAIGRQMIADPGSAGKVLAGKESEIVPCKECMACFASLRKGPVICKVNRNLPWASDEA